MKSLAHIKKVSFILILIIGCSSLVKAQSRDELEKRREEKLKEIAFTQKLIDDTGDEQKKNINYLVIIARQIKNREQLISTENRVLKLYNTSISQTREFVMVLEEDLERLKVEYKEMAYLAYRNRSSFDYLLFLFASESLQQAWNRMRYIRAYNETRVNQVEVIRSTQLSLEDKVIYLQEQISEKRKLLSSLEKDKGKLQRDRQLKNELLGELKSKESEYKESLKQSRKIAKELDEAIEEIIKNEIAKNEEASPEVVELSGLSSEEFAKNKSSFIWPTVGIVSQPFGRQAHPTIPNVYISNHGIEIRTENNAEVHAVFMGLVIRTVYIPGAENAVIVQHGDYYTVYKNLVNVKVKPGQAISEGTVLGNVAFNESKQLSELHFEMRLKTEKLNPQLWLKKR